MQFKITGYIFKRDDVADPAGPWAYVASIDTKTLNEPAVYHRDGFATRAAAHAAMFAVLKSLTGRMFGVTEHADPSPPETP